MLHSNKDRKAMKPCVFIHTNHKQIVGALVAEYALKRNSPNADKFDVALIHTKDYPFMRAREGQEFRRGGTTRTWHMEDLQSFTPLRFMPPKLMGYQGRAVVIDPDIFAAGDIYPLLTRDMQGKAIMCRMRGRGQAIKGAFASSVMLLDCEKLTHWDPERDFPELFEGKRDYLSWISLRMEDPETIGLFETYWNDFDKLTPETRLLHNTKRKTQPWKTGLPVDFIPAEKVRLLPGWGALMRLRRRLFGDYGLLGHYRPHPDPNQERFFFGLLRECLEKGIVTQEMLQHEMQHNHVRHDALQVVERTPTLDMKPLFA